MNLQILDFENVGTIYKIVNIINNKIYIGCTIKSIDVRFKEHKSRCISNKYKSKLYNSMSKYGIDNFIISEICNCSKKELYNLEMKYIKEFDSFNTGLNSTIGGEGCLNYKHTPESLEKMSKIQKEKMIELRVGKTYSDIYGEEKAIIEKQKRSESTYNMWKNITEEDKKNRINKQLSTALHKAGYTKELVLEIRKLHKEGIKPRFLLKQFPNLTSNDIKNITDKRKWNNL